MFLNCRGKPVHLEEKPAQTGPTQPGDLNPEPAWWKAPVLTTAPPCHLRVHIFCVKVVFQKYTQPHNPLLSVCLSVPICIPADLVDSPSRVNYAPLWCSCESCAYACAVMHRCHFLDSWQPDIRKLNSTDRQSEQSSRSEFVSTGQSPRIQVRPKTTQEAKKQWSSLRIFYNTNQTLQV